MNYYIIDIEANGLKDPTQIWCVVLEDLKTNIQHEFLDKTTLADFLQGVDYTFIGHNIIDYDIPVLTNLWDITIKDENIIDTLILSRLYSPKLEGGHSLAAWGERLGVLKKEFNDFSKFSEEMLEYCKQDVTVTKQLYRKLSKEVDSGTKASRLEHKIAIALREAKKYGFYFDVNKAIDLKIELEKEREIYDIIIQDAYPPYETGKRVKKLVHFNPNSSKQVIDKLWEAGWKPTEYTEGYKDYLNGHKKPDKEADEKEWEKYLKKGIRYIKYGWKISEKNMSSLPDHAPISVKCILKRTILETRIRKLDEWLNLVGDDSAIHGTIVGLGTWTHRMVHQNPNLANISAKKSIKYHSEDLNKLATDLGGRMRGLWVARPGRVLVGTDAEGIQLRVLAHYMEDEEFTKSVTEGKKENGTDPHSLNQKRIGRGTRDNAKTFIYAFLLGAGDSKVGEIYNVSKSVGRELKESFITSTPGLKQLKKKRIPIEARQGFTYGFDGRKILCDSEHLMMAAYLQGGEAIVMKLAVVIALDYIKLENIDAQLINIVHDEMLFECDEKDAERVREISEYSIYKAGEILELKCPMKGEGKIGINWLEVH